MTVYICHNSLNCSPKINECYLYTNCTSIKVSQEKGKHWAIDAVLQVSF